MTTIKSLVFERRFASGEVGKLGTAVQRADGWRFVPAVAGRMSSRKAHPTLEKCLPRWVGYPDYCESRRFVPGKDT